MKRYTTRLQIIDDIDKAIKKIKRSEEIAQEHLDQEEFLKGIDSQIARLRQHREQADKMFRRIKRLQTRRLPFLKEKLAEFDTLTLPSLSTDISPEKNSQPCTPPQHEPAFSSDDVLP